MVSANRLRVLVLGNLPPHVMGGAENQIVRLVEHWLAAGVRVEVAGWKIPDGEQALGDYRVRTHSLRGFGRGGRVGRAVGFFVGLSWLALTRRDFDVVYCRGLGDGVVTIALLRALGICRWKMVGCPINARGTGDVAFLRSIPGWRLWCRLIDRHMDALNLINPLIAADLDAVGIRRPPRSTIPNGIGLQAPLPRARVSPLRQLLWTGRMEPQKGLDLLLPALAACRAGGARFQLNLLGEGPMQAPLLAQVEALDLHDCVAFLGAVPASEVRANLARADVLLLPSRYEGMSNAVLEAMEAGLPVLCTRCGGLDTVVEDGAGWVCEPNDVAALERALGAMFTTDDAGLLERGRRARAQVEAHFAIEPVARANLELLERVVRGHAPA